MSLRYERSQPLLSTEPTTRQRAVSVATQLATEMNKGERYRIPVGKYACEICKLFEIPLLPKESVIKVATKKLQDWGLQIGLKRISNADLEAVLPQLETILGAIRQAIASKINSREQRKKANGYRLPKQRITSAVNPIHLPEQWGGNPYDD
jgi:hypothetical protein